MRAQISHAESILHPQRPPASASESIRGRSATAERRFQRRPGLPQGTAPPAALQQDPSTPRPTAQRQGHRMGEATCRSAPGCNLPAGLLRGVSRSPRPHAHTPSAAGAEYRAPPLKPRPLPLGGGSRAPGHAPEADRPRPPRLGAWLPRLSRRSRRLLPQHDPAALLACTRPDSSFRGPLLFPSATATPFTSSGPHRLPCSSLQMHTLAFPVPPRPTAHGPRAPPAAAEIGGLAAGRPAPPARKRLLRRRLGFAVPGQARPRRRPRACPGPGAMLASLRAPWRALAACRPGRH